MAAAARLGPLQSRGCPSSDPQEPPSPGSPKGMLGVGPQTPQAHSTVSIAVPTTAEDYESEDDSEEEEEHPLSRGELHAKTMRGLAKREAGKKVAPKAGGAAKGRR